MNGALPAEQVPDHPVVQHLVERHAERDFGDESRREAFFRKLSYGEYLGMLARLNAAVLGRTLVPGEGWGRFSGFQAYQVEDTSDAVGLLDPGVRVLYAGADPLDSNVLTYETFKAAQNTHPIDRGAFLLGMGTVAIHAQEDGHTRTAAVLRDLFGRRGFTGSRADRDHYNGIMQNARAPAYNLSPARADLHGEYAKQKANTLMRAHGYDGPLVTGVLRFTVRELCHMVSERVSPDLRPDVAAKANEAGFGLLTLAAFMCERSLEPRDFLVGELTGPLIHAAQLVHEVRSNNSAHVFINVFRQHKRAFIRSLIECFGPDDDRSIFGDPNQIIATYYR